MNVLDLFSGIGGFSLGLERAGMRTVAFCEIEPYARAVLKKHWPDVPCYEDVRELSAERLAADGIHVDVICGGFPCQDISTAGNGVGLSGSRSGLWSEYRRLIEEIRPRFVIIENVAVLRTRGLEKILGQLAALGFDAEWHCIPASAVGAPHIRDRVWIVAYAHSELVREQSGWRGGTHRANSSQPELDGSPQLVADANCEGQLQPSGRQQEQRGWTRNSSSDVSDTDCEPPRRLAIAWGECSQWLVEPAICRVANGVPSRMDRIRCLGNAVVPQIPEIIGRAIMKTVHLDRFPSPVQARAQSESECGSLRKQPGELSHGD